METQPGNGQRTSGPRKQRVMLDSFGPAIRREVKTEAVPFDWSRVREAAVCSALTTVSGWHDTAVVVSEESGDESGARQGGEESPKFIHGSEASPE